MFYKQLHGLRGVLAYAVVAYHVSSATTVAFGRVTRDWYAYGHHAVSAFMVLSGFLITGILLRVRDSIDAGQQRRWWSMLRFEEKRVLRIVPPYFTFLAVGSTGVLGAVATWLIMETAIRLLVHDTEERARPAFLALVLSTAVFVIGMEAAFIPQLALVGTLLHLVRSSDEPRERLRLVVGQLVRAARDVVVGLRQSPGRVAALVAAVAGLLAAGVPLFGELAWGEGIRWYPLEVLCVGGACVADALPELVRSMVYVPGEILHFTFTFTWRNTLGVTFPNTGPIDILWSLSVEEQFYWMWPLLVWTVPKRRVLAAMLGVIGAALAWRMMAFYWVHPGGTFAQQYTTLSCLDLFAAGGLLGYGVHRFGSIGELRTWLRTKWWYRPLLLGLVAAYAAFVLVAYQWGPGPPATPTAIARAVPLQHTVDAGFWLVVIYRLTLGMRGPVGRLLETRVLQYFGTVSYTMYLIHLAIWAVVREPLAELFGSWGLSDSSSPLFGAANLAVVTALVLVACHLIRHVIELPIAELGRSLRYRRPRSEGAESAPS